MNLLFQDDEVLWSLKVGSFLSCKKLVVNIEVLCSATFSISSEFIDGC